MMTTAIKNIQIAIAAGLFAIAALLMMDYAFSMPVVVESYSTGNCIEVVNYPGAFFHKETFSCENMPTKYTHEWGA